MRLTATPLLFASLAVELVGQQPSPPVRTTAIQRTLAATVTVEVVSSHGAATGSGVIISPLGIIVTAAHVIDGATTITVHNAQISTTSVTGIYVIDRALDFALIKAPLTSAPT